MIVAKVIDNTVYTLCLCAMDLDPKKVEFISLFSATWRLHFVHQLKSLASYIVIAAITIYEEYSYLGMKYIKYFDMHLFCTTYQSTGSHYVLAVS